MLERRAIVIGFYLPNIGQSIGNRSLFGERHEFRLRVIGPDAEAVYTKLTIGLEDAEVPIPRHLLADVVVEGSPTRERDGSISFAIEALTIAE